eukprot:5159209-Amphidinium_carterae.1
MVTFRGDVPLSGTQRPLNEYLPMMIVRPRPGSTTSLAEGGPFKGLVWVTDSLEVTESSGEPMKIQ